MKDERTWEEMYTLYNEYIKAYHKVEISLEKIYKGERLGVWVYQQFYHKDKLNQEQVDKMEDLGFHWDIGEILGDKVSKFIITWHDRYSLLLEYEEEKGHTLLTSTEVYKGVPLGSWLYRQRAAFDKGELSDGKEILLVDLGVFLGSWEEQGWDYKYYYAKRYHQRHKNLKVPVGYQIGGFNLYSWLEFQKKKKLDGALESDRIKKLEAIDIQWSKTYADKWEEKYEIAKKYKQEKGSLDTCRNEVYGGINLDAWLNNQRRAKRGEKHRRISDKQIEKLDELGMKW